jgi:hypothetical protein
MNIIDERNAESARNAQANSVCFPKENGFHEWIHPMRVLKVVPYDERRCIILLDQRFDFAVPVLGTVEEAKERLRLAAYAQLGLTPTPASHETDAGTPGK